MPVPTLPQAPAPFAETTTRKTGSLSARQLLDIELGLFLLSQLLPTAPPDALSELLTGDHALANRPTWTARQHRYLNRARLLLGHFQQRGRWLNQIERYATGSSYRQAYAISQDRSCFGEKSVGFFRSRLSALRQMLG
ncbi:MAG: hypothetical protein H7Z72_08695 [Bacteroidetes bacterium]|nr:hypothetical protein [Fibrella sp.]